MDTLKVAKKVLCDLFTSQLCDSSKCLRFSPSNTLPVYNGSFPKLHGSPYSLLFLKDRSCLGQWRKILSSCKVCFLGVSYHQVKPRVLTEFTASSSIISIMLSQPKTKKAFQSSTPKGIIIPQKEKPGHIYQKEDELQNEATILGVSPPHYKEDIGEILQMYLS